MLFLNNNSLVSKSLESFKQMFKEKQIHSETIVFNNLVIQLKSIKIFGKLS